MSRTWRCAVLVLLWLWTGRALAVNDDDIRVEVFTLAAPGVSPTPLRLRAWLPPGYDTADQRYPVLYLNDGQDAERIGLQDTLHRMTHAGQMRPIIVIAIDMPPDRMAGYGFFDRKRNVALPASTRYGPIGANALAYAKWMTTTLIPDIDTRYRTIARADGRALLGWSLGAASAFGIGWQYPELFGKVGAFSPSFWLSERREDAAAVQATRFAHRLVESYKPKPRPAVFIGVGTMEETDDRDGDGIIDVLDDSRDLLLGWETADGKRHKGLRQRGYAVNPDYATHPRRQDAVLYQLPGGKHHQDSWKVMLPVFLRWAYPPLRR